MAKYQRLKDLREDKDMNQTEIAKIIYTTKKQYSRWETGEYNIPFEKVFFPLNDAILLCEGRELAAACHNEQ